MGWEYFVAIFDLWLLLIDRGGRGGVAKLKMGV